MKALTTAIVAGVLTVGAVAVEAQSRLTGRAFDVTGTISLRGTESECCESSW